MLIIAGIAMVMSNALVMSHIKYYKDLKLFNSTPIWLTQKQMSELFGRDRVAITQHIGNIFKEEELEENLVCKDFLLTAKDGKSIF